MANYEETIIRVYLKETQETFGDFVGKFVPKDKIYLKNFGGNLVLHRPDGPAIEYNSGTKYWFLNGKPHRIGGPAIEFLCGYKEWRQNGFLHRTDGPAIEYSNGTKYWYIEAQEFSEEDFNKKCKKVNP